jgi:anaerobic magnesium-protoporphyrin IX monomethyl ester cyclase
MNKRVSSYIVQRKYLFKLAFIEKRMLREIKDLKNIPRTKKKKRVLFINPRRVSCDVNMPHMGLALLASILKTRGHDVLIVDYQLTHNAPKILSFVRDFKPSIIGVSIITGNVNESFQLINEIRKTESKIPIIVGGPHASLYPEHLKQHSGIDYVVSGEAEPIIISLIEAAKRNKEAIVVSPKTIVDPNKIPYPDYKAFYGWSQINSYPIMTSRGCPFRCSFCPVAHVGQKKWRPRDSEDCIRELEIAKKIMPHNFSVFIQDDNPLVIPERFYKFLELFSERIKLPLAITNVRADNINDKFLFLLKKVGVYGIGIAVESANPEVFKQINKGETLETIDSAAKLIKKHKMSLSFCFVIGLPGDNLERVKDSIRFANKHNPDFIFWNMAMPYKNTGIRTWFEKNGTIFNEIGKSSLNDGSFICDAPSVETPDFTIWQREKAHYMALFRTTHDRLRMRDTFKILSVALKYDELRDFLYWWPRGLVKSLKLKLKLLIKFINHTKKEGLTRTLKRAAILLNK